MRKKSHLPKKRSRDNTGPESTRESASTSTSLKREASLGMEITLTGRGYHENVSCTEYL